MLKKSLLGLLLSAPAVAPVHAAASTSLEGAAGLASLSADGQVLALQRLFDGMPNAAPRVGALIGSQGSQAALRATMLRNLDFIQNSFEAQYAPARWKEQYSGWDLEREIKRAKDQIAASPNITLKEYQGLVRRLFQSTKDYHVGVSFVSTERSSLPFSVIGAQGRYFIANIDRNKLPESSFPFKPGDELVAFGGRPTADVVKELAAGLGDNSALTDKALAAFYLTWRSTVRMGGAEQGPITVTVKPKGSPKAFTRQLIWDYNPELVPAPKTKSLMSIEAGNGSGGSKLPIPWLDDMRSPMHKATDGAAAGNPYQIGGRESWVPALGAKIWESDKTDTFYAYIYRAADGRILGYVRIPHYGGGDPKSIGDFARIIAKFEATTDALVIDQVNNPGGSVFYLYALVSMLTDQAASTPRHRIAITQEDVQGAIEFLANEKAVTGDAEAKALLGPTLGGYPVDYELFRHLVEFSRFIVEEWKAGRTLTEPTFLWGVDQINPSLQARYTKPILLLVNELDFSGGDFFPAILQDNKRVTVFGARTAGAGGFVRGVEYPNSLGIAGFSMTGSIAERVSKDPIENLGVRPDIRYTPTPADVQGGYQGYKKAVEAALARLLGPTKKK